MSNDLIQMALDSGGERQVGHAPRWVLMNDKSLAAMKAAILADAAGDVEPSLFVGMSMKTCESRHFATKGMAEALGYTSGVETYYSAATVAALTAERDALREDAMRWRDMRDRLASEGINAIRIDLPSDQTRAAIAAGGKT